MMIKQFFKDIKKYSKYISYSARAQLKSEVANSYLSWIWLFLEPICFMLIYTFLAVVVFNSRVEYFPIFVFIGITFWNFFSKTLTGSVRLVPANREIVTKVYVPKFIILLTKMCVNSVKFFISFSLVIICMIIYQVPISFNVLYFIPIFITLFVVTFGVSTIFMHFGVFIKDLANITTIALRLLFYASGVFFAIETRVPEPYNILIIILNPIAALITECRDVLLYCTPMNMTLIMSWLLIGILIAYIGIRIIYKYENTYVKVMK